MRVGSTLYVVADDELQLGAFSIDDDTPGTLIRMLSGDLPDCSKERKKAKPDFEMLTMLGPFSHYPHGALLALGSGSRKRRRRGVLIGLDGHGVDSTSVRILDASDLFEVIEEEIDDINIEGAFVQGPYLSLMHRGNKSHALNAIVSVDLEAVLRSIEHDESIGKPQIKLLKLYDLGAIGDVPLCFTDGAALPDGNIVFSAVAEDTSDSYHDGGCLGSAVGMIGDDGKIKFVSSLDEACKIEGVHAEYQAGALKLWAVSDADDARVPALLLTGILSVPMIEG